MTMSIWSRHALERDRLKTQGSNAGRLACLDGLRGILSLMVVVIHSGQIIHYPAPVQPWITDLGDGGLAVDMFFVLSGLVVFNSLLSFRGQIVPSIVARAARIYPAYLVALAASLPLVFCGFIPQPFWAHLLAHLTMTHGLFPNDELRDIHISILQPAWSLSTEWQFYLLMAGWVAVGGLYRRQASAIFMLLGLAGVWLGRNFSPAFLPNEAHLFALGIATSALFVRQDRAPWDGFLLALAACLAVVLLRGAPTKLVVPLGWVVIVAAQLNIRGTGMVRITLESAPLRWLGKVSYSLYLIHFPILLLFAEVWNPAGRPLLSHFAWMLTILWICLAASALMQQYVEVPFNLAGHRAAKALTDSPRALFKIAR
jgi:peptidoglycan/LPS O-acetylase OafA/YrhL